MTTVIGPNIKKESTRIDAEGNEIDPRTKQIVKSKESEYKIPVNVQSNSTIEKVEPVKNLSITEQIKQAKDLLANLELQKIAEIERKRKELEELEKDA